MAARHNALAHADVSPPSRPPTSASRPTTGAIHQHCYVRKAHFIIEIILRIATSISPVANARGSQSGRGRWGQSSGESSQLVPETVDMIFGWDTWTRPSQGMKSIHTAGKCSQVWGNYQAMFELYTSLRTAENNWCGPSPKTCVILHLSRQEANNLNEQKDNLEKVSQPGCQVYLFHQPGKGWSLRGTGASLLELDISPRWTTSWLITFLGTRHQ